MCYTLEINLSRQQPDKRCNLPAGSPAAGMADRRQRHHTTGTLPPMLSHEKGYSICSSE